MEKTITPAQARTLVIAYEAYMDAIRRQAHEEPGAAISLRVWGRLLWQAQQETGVHFFSQSSLIR
jgi:hypothetical protein